MALRRSVNAASGRMRVRDAIAQTPQLFDDGGAGAQNCLELLLRVTARREVQRVLDPLVQRREIVAGVVGRAAVLKDRLASRLEQCSGGGDGPLGIRCPPFDCLRP